MKQLFIFLVFLISITCHAQSIQIDKRGVCNILIGHDAGKYLTLESYCVIIGRDSIHVNTKGNNLIWIVDYSEPFLLNNPDIKDMILNYENNVIKKGKDNMQSRCCLVLKFINRKEIY